MDLNSFRQACGGWPNSPPRGGGWLRGHAKFPEGKGFFLFCLARTRSRATIPVEREPNESSRRKKRKKLTCNRGKDPFQQRKKKGPITPRKKEMGKKKNGWGKGVLDSKNNKKRKKKD